MFQKKNTNPNQTDIIQKLFFKLLPVQILIIAMGSINSIVDGVIAGRFIDSTSVGVIGLYYSMVNILNAVGSVLLGGTAVLIGRYMGQADKDKTEGIFSLNIVTTSLIGLAIMVLSLLFSHPLARLLGATEELMEPLVTYIRWYAIGIVPLLLGQQVASFLQLELQRIRAYVGIVAMIISNLILNISLVVIFRLGIQGLALSTSICNWIYFFILGSYYLTKKAQLRVNYHKIPWHELGDVIKIGLPGATLVFALSIRGIVINRILLTYAGNDGLSAMSAFNMISGLLIAFCLGMGAVVRMLTSVFIGEENQVSIKQVMKVAYTRGLPISLGLTLLVVVCAGLISQIFFPDVSSVVYQMSKQLVIIYGLCIPLILICIINSNYLQAWGHHLFVNILSVVDGFFAMVIPALILAPILGAFGVWIANPIGIAITALMTPLYCMLYWKKMKLSLDELLFIPKDFGVAKEDRFDRVLRTIEDVVEASEEIRQFALRKGINKKIANYSALCLEEIASNVIEHGFTKDNKEHSLETNVVKNGKTIILRVKDDCIPFNPEERLKIVSPDDPLKNIGIRIVHELADEVIYQNLIGLNILTMKLNTEAGQKA